MPFCATMKSSASAACLKYNCTVCFSLSHDIVTTESSSPIIVIQSASRTETGPLARRYNHHMCRDVLQDDCYLSSVWVAASSMGMWMCACLGAEY
mmetsp:Transcript_8220/g.20996  ORF Transcript_8220/g.20996 Transcript_8220/m.20996 type:complete len:95 (-) Transcript_8220:453-737(-)